MGHTAITTYSIIINESTDQYKLILHGGLANLATTTKTIKQFQKTSGFLLYGKLRLLRTLSTMPTCFTGLVRKSL